MDFYCSALKGLEKKRDIHRPKKKCSFLRKCSYKERARKSLSNIY